MFWLSVRDKWLTGSQLKFKESCKSLPWVCSSSDKEEEHSQLVINYIDKSKLVRLNINIFYLNKGEKYVICRVGRLVCCDIFQVMPWSIRSFVHQHINNLRLVNDCLMWMISFDHFIIPVADMPNLSEGALIYITSGILRDFCSITAIFKQYSVLYCSVALSYIKNDK